MVCDCDSGRCGVKQWACCTDRRSACSQRIADHFNQWCCAHFLRHVGRGGCAKAPKEDLIAGVVLPTQNQAELTQTVQMQILIYHMILMVMIQMMRT